MKMRKAFPTPLDDGQRVLTCWLLWSMTVCALAGCRPCMTAVMKEGPLHA